MVLRAIADPTTANSFDYSNFLPWQASAVPAANGII
jgi:hypothetical protein